MPVNIHIEGQNAGEALADLAHLARALLNADTPQGVAATRAADDSGNPNITPPTAEPEAPKATRAPRKAKDTTAPVVQADPPAVAAQDTADEQAEVEQAPAKTLSHDDIRNAMAAYLKAYGTPATQEDGPKLLQSVTPGITKISEVPVDQETLAKTLAAIEAATTGNPYQRAKAA